MAVAGGDGDRCVLGIDEAGRGPVLGPLVYTAAACLLSDLPKLEQLGCDDSKAMSAEARLAVRARLDGSGLVREFTAVLSAEELSRKMLRQRTYNLNQISHDTAILLVHRALAAGVEVHELYVDTVGDPDRYAARLRREFPGVARVVVKAKADSLYRIVGAASILAKTERDRVLERWTCEDIHPGLELGYGSGYPADPSTQAWLSAAVDRHFGFPSLVRFSWGTAKNMLKATRAVQVRFEGDADDVEGEPATMQDVREHFRKRARPAGREPAKFYVKRHLHEADGLF